MLRSSLKPLGGAELCEAAGLSPEDRAEVIDLAGFLRLARAVTGDVQPTAPDSGGATMMRRKRG